MDVSRQGGPVKDEVVHHHVQCQSWSPVRDRLLQGTRRLLLGFDLLLNRRDDHQEKGPVLGGNPAGTDGARQQGVGQPTAASPDSPTARFLSPEAMSILISLTTIWAAT